MLDHDDLKWIATTSTELNSVLQQISRYADLAKQHKGEFNYIEMMADRVELASKTSQELFDRVTSKILAAAATKAPAQAGAGKAPAFTVVPAPPKPPSFPQTSTRSKPTPPPARRGKQPRRTLAPAREIPATPEFKVRNPKGNRELILVVEDEVEIAEFVCETLMDEGYKVILANDGFEALKIYQQLSSQIGLVILDFFLPVMDGDAVFEELRALNPNVNAVLSSGFAEQSKLSTMLSHGLRGFIPKPYTRAKLLEQVRSTLEAARQPPR
ncbi:MAG: two-component system, cell cycle sensor histidine kinase and response regulator CckA [Verrucomicrobiota bacterium]|jgi:CheY-like chemotaxis protein